MAKLDFFPYVEFVVAWQNNTFRKIYVPQKKLPNLAQ